MTLAATTLAQLDALIAEHALLQHPFYQAWNHGTLTRDQLAGYARQYYRHIERFPQYLEVAEETCLNAEVRALLAENRAEELNPEQPHPMLWMRFAESLGNTHTMVENEVELAESAQAHRLFEGLALGGPLESLAGLYAYEAQIPAVAKTKIDGLECHYADLNTDAGYFHVHQDIDVEHAADARAMLATLIRTEDDAAAVLAAGRQSLKASNLLLDGVCRAYEVPCH